MALGRGPPLTAHACTVGADRIAPTRWLPCRDKDSTSMTLTFGQIFTPAPRSASDVDDDHPTDSERTGNALHQLKDPKAQVSHTRGNG